MRLKSLELLDLFFVQLVISLEFLKLLMESLGFFKCDLVLLLLLFLWLLTDLFSTLRSFWFDCCTLWSLNCLLLFLSFLLIHHFFHRLNLLRINLLFLSLHLLILLLLKELCLFCLNIHHWFLSLIFFFPFWFHVLILRFIFRLFFSLRHGSVWELDLSFNLHSFIIRIKFIFLTFCK